MNNLELHCNKDVMISFLKSVKIFGGDLFPKIFYMNGGRQDLLPRRSVSKND